MVVLRSSRGLHRSPSCVRNRCPDHVDVRWKANLCKKAPLRCRRRYRPTKLHGIWPSHVLDRDQPYRERNLHNQHGDNIGPVRRAHALLHRHTLQGRAQTDNSNALCAGLGRHLRNRRTLRRVQLIIGSRHSVERHLFRGGSLSLRDGWSIRIWFVCRDLLLAPENDGKNV